MTVLTKADFFKLKTKVEAVEVENLGEVYIKEMNASEREGFENTMNEQVDEGGVRATLVIYTVCDKDSNLMFDKEDLDNIKAMPTSVVTALFDASDEINKISASQIEKAEKN